jgi:hypothetical protein
MGHRGNNGSRTPGHAGSGAPGSDDASEWTAAWHDDGPWPDGQEWRDAPGDGYGDDAWYGTDGGADGLADLARGAAARGPAQGYPPDPGQPGPVYPQGTTWSGSGEHPAWDSSGGTGPNGYMQAPWETGPAVPDQSGPHLAHTGDWEGNHWDHGGQAGQAGAGEWDSGAPHTGQYDASEIADWDGGHTGEWTGAPAGAAEWDTDVPHTGQYDASQIAQWGDQGAEWDAAEGHWVEPYGEDYPAGPGPGEGGDDRATRGRKNRRRRKDAAPAGPAAAPRKRSGRSARGGSRNRTIILAAAGAVIVAALGATAYTFLAGRGAKTGPQASTAGPKLPATQPSPLSTSAASKLGKWGHITSRSTDKTPLGLNETFPAQFLINGVSLVRTADRSDTDCTQALFGSALQAAAKHNGCSQVVRASYMSSDQKLMGTIGVVNLSTSNGAARVGQASGPNDFVTPLVSKTGPTRDLNKGTGVVQAEYKGHYLILIWAEFANLRAPSTSSARTQLERFSSDLISGSANIALSNRMVNGHS